ncbi:MAG: hypothetical protein MJE12_01120 [Alphaproteobacteria bacterium]|nr:hypothetical protein [Alphaproteobacteria bacterium]
MTVRFDREFAADLGPAIRRLGTYLRGARLAPDRRGAEFELTGDYRLSAFHSNRSVVLDLLPHRQVGNGAARDKASRRADRVRIADRTGTPLLGVRVGKHSKYTRLVFDWSEKVGYDIDQDAESVTIRFAKRARIDVALLQRRLQAGLANPVAKIAENGVELSLTKASDTQIRHFRLGSKIVVDLMHAAGTATSDKAAKTAPERSNTLAASAKAATPKGAASDEPPPPRAAPRQAVDTASLPLPEKPESGPAAPSIPLSASMSEPAQELVAEPPLDPSAASEPVVAAATEEDTPTASATPQGQEMAAASPSEGKTDAAGNDTAASDEAPADSDDNQVSLVFEWPEPVGAAVFVRKPYVWIVFDRRAQLNLAALRDAGKDMISQIEQLPLGSATVVRLRPEPGVNPHVEKEQFNWVVSFRKWPVAAKIPIAFKVKPDAIEGAELEFPVSEIGRLIHIPDPAVGDMLEVATLRAPGHGIPEHHRYPEFEILPSAQGLAIDPLSDDVEIKEAGQRGLVVAAPGGLHVSSVTQNETGTGVYMGPRIFNFEIWKRRGDGGFTEARRAALRAVVEAPAERRDDARLDLARFYFAHGFASEALGVLRTIQFSNEDMAAQPEFRALVGAALVHMGRFQEARKDLLDPRLDEFLEIALWRGSMFQQAGDLKKAAAQFRTGDPVLQSYPEPMRTKLALERVETSLAVLDVGNASIWLNFLAKLKDRMARKDQARLLYNQGLLARDSRDLDRAVELWMETKKTGDRWHVARSEMSLIELGLQQETMTETEATERLDKLRFQWRGDRLELAVLRRLGDLHLSRHDYRKGLNVLRAAVTYFPDEPDVKDIAQRMTTAFKTLHLEGGADKMPPLKALALYDDFRELTPAGAQGDRMIQRLADRLVAVDLLDRAADLLSHQVRYRLKGEEKARVGAKLAVIQLLDRQPKKALSALRASFQSNLPQSLEDDRRRIRAKATMELGRFEEAIALLAGDVSREADLLRANIYWSTQNYTEVAKVLQRLAGDPLEESGYDEEQATFILNWAVALRLKRDLPGLKTLRDLYGTGMAQSPLSDSFAFIASPSGEDSKKAQNIEAVARKIIETDKFEAFLKNYRNRLVAGPSRRVAPEGPAASTRAAGSGAPATEPAPTRPAPETAPNDTAPPSAVPPPPPSG